MRPTVILTALLAASLVAGGCGGPKVKFLHTAPGLYVPDGSTAVLQVNAAPLSGADGYKYLYGKVPAPAPAVSFAELLAHYGREAGGLEVLSPHEAARRLEEKSATDVLAKSRTEADRRARELGCETYLAVSVKRWGYSYFLFSEKGAVDFTVECRRPGSADPLWEAYVRYKKRGMDERQVAGEALRAMFQELLRQREP